MRWVKDQKVEANLRKLGIKFEVETVQLKDIDLEEGIRRQARLLGKLNDDYVLQIGVAVQAPEAVLPYVILHKPPHKGKLFPLSGNHRLAGVVLALPEEKTIDCYIVTITDVVLMDLLPRVANAWESGLGFSKEERIANARWMMERHSLSLDDVSKMFGLKKEWVATSRRAEEVKQCIADIPKANGIATSTLVKMAPLLKNKAVARATAKLLADHTVKGDESRMIIDEVSHADRSELEQMGVLARWDKVFEERKNPKTRKTKTQFSTKVREMFVRHLSSLANILQNYDTLEKLQCTDPADRDVVARSWVVIAKVMDKLSKEGGAK